MTNDKSHEILN